jgi:ABC-type uncharacterized transport system substrate-binding protein
MIGAIVRRRDSGPGPIRGRFGTAIVLPAILAVAMPAVAPSALADVGNNEVKIAARALGFLEKPLTGSVRVGIVYAPDDRQSSQDAATLQKLMEGGLKVGSLNLNPVMVPIDSVDTVKVDLLFVTDGLGARAAKAGNAAQVKRIPCITLDADQVRNGNCAIGVEANPRVEILVNRAAAARSGVSFAGAFKMLITEF